MVSVSVNLDRSADSWNPELFKSELKLIWHSAQVTDRLGFLRVLVCSHVDGPLVHHGPREQVSQLCAEGCRHRLVGRREGRSHEEGRGFRCWWDDIGGVNEEARGGGVGRHRVTHGSNPRSHSGSSRGGLMKLGLQLCFLLQQKHQI